MLLGCGRRGPALHDGHHALAVVVAVDGERGHVAGPHAVEMLDGPFQILRPDIATVDNDQVLGTPGNDNLAIKQIAEVTGIQPAICAESLGRQFRLPEIAGHDAGAAKEHPANPTFRERHAGFIAADEAEKGMAEMSEKYREAGDLYIPAAE